MDFPVNLEMWQLIIGALLPGVVAFFKNQTWASDYIKICILFAISVVISALQIFIAGQFMVGDWIGNALKVAFLATAAYAWVWRPSGADQKITNLFGVGKH